MHSNFIKKMETVSKKRPAVTKGYFVNKGPLQLGDKTYYWENFDILVFNSAEELFCVNESNCESQKQFFFSKQVMKGTIKS